MKVFIFDAARCSGCHGCQVACKDEHCGADWLPYSKAQPDVGQFWLKINETEHGSVPKVKVEYKPQMCQHCDNAPCIAAGDGAVYKREDGLVIIDPEKAKNKKELVDSCPYGAIYWNEELGIAQKCAGCAQLLEKGEEPRCVDFCALKALRFGEEEDFAEEIAKADISPLQKQTQSRVYYLNLPKFFVAGEVWDPEINEVIKKAKVTLTGENGFSEEAKTDLYGDFWFKRIEAGVYTVTIEAEGYETKVIENLNVDKSINLGDLPLTGDGTVEHKAVQYRPAAEILEELGIFVGEYEEDIDVTVSGNVVEIETNEPLENVEITLRGKGTYKAKTDKDGLFSVNVKISGVYQLNAKCEGYKIYGKKINVENADLVADTVELRVADASEVMTSFS